MGQFELLQAAAAAAPDEAPARKAADAYKTISEVSDEIDVPQHVLRFWETHFPQVKPSRMRGSRRYYRPEDVDLLKKIKTLLYSQGYTIKGAKKLVRDRKSLEMEIEALEQSQVRIPNVPAVEVQPEAARAAVDVKALIRELKILRTMLDKESGSDAL